MTFMRPFYSFIAIIASLGLNAVPVGLVSILVILNTVDLPTDDVPLNFTIDWLMYAAMNVHIYSDFPA